ncbi:MAG TPA: plastocyanin/azurin family copper-binding protein [Candidatus Krumholzibacteria bacterium]|nr:plastocyanin/azurin family copper-binding protein [Candidatus Krumholzibacteria bacterium]
MRLRFCARLFSLPLLLGVSMLACGGDDSTGPPEDAPFTGTIHILDDRFSPRDVTVAAGDSVTWRWEGSHSHSVTQGTTPDASQDPSRLFDSGIKNSGTFGYRFTAAGSVPYFCRPHFAIGMKGTVTVTP